MTGVTAERVPTHLFWAPPAVRGSSDSTSPRTEGQGHPGSTVFPGTEVASPHVGCVCLLCVDGAFPGKHTPHRAQVLTCGLTVSHLEEASSRARSLPPPQHWGRPRHCVLEPGWCPRPPSSRSVLLFCLVSHSHLGLPLSAMVIITFFLVRFSCFPGSSEQPEVFPVATTAPHQQETGSVPAPCPAQWGAPEGPGNL